MRAGQTPDAIPLLERICEMDRRDADAWLMLATAHYALRQFAAAEQALSIAVTANPESTALHLALGDTLVTLSRSHEAVREYQRAVEINPGHIDGHARLAVALAQSGRPEEGVEACRTALRLDPRRADVHFNLGNMLNALRRQPEAEEAFRVASLADPTHLDARNNLASLLKDSGRIDEARELYESIIRANPRYANAHNNLGIICEREGQLTRALFHYQTASGIAPNDVEILANQANALLATARIDEAIKLYQRASRNDPASPTSSARLFAMNYKAIDPAALFAEHVDWGQRLAITHRFHPYRDTRHDLDRKFRIGYVSPDFRTHSVAFFIEPILAYHDRETFEIYCYAEVNKPDETTNRLKSHCDVWRDIVGKSDNAVAELIHSDGIDILVDLAGHTAANRLLAFARKPAPVQVTYLGYPNTTGLPAMDYRLTDTIADPPGQEVFHTERLVRLPDGFLCYQPPGHTPAVKPAPGLVTEYVTFGSFNNLAKIGEGVVALWSKLLHTAPKSRLILKNMSLRDEETRNRYLALFLNNGIASERIELIGWLPSKEDHLALYHRIDIALDTFPYNGTTTTCEALWMGVPVVVLSGNRHAGRVGMSLLTQVGLTGLIAQNPDDYVRIASTLATDLRRLAALRADLREQMATSPLCDGVSFTRELETAYREMWQRFSMRQ